MRYHRDWAIAQIWSQLRGVTDLLTPEKLVFARVEAVTKRDLPGVVLDLRFESDEHVLCVPGIYIDEFSIFTKTRDTLIWPEIAMRLATDRQLAAVERLVYPWLEFALTAQGAEQEKYQFFGDHSIKELFLEARSQGLLSAVPLSQSAVQYMVAGFASRFAAGAHVACSREHLNAGMMITRYAGSVVFPDVDERARRIAERWFGHSLPSSHEQHAASLILGDELLSKIEHTADARVLSLNRTGSGLSVPYITPRATDDLLRIGEENHEQKAFSVHAHEKAITRKISFQPEPTGGSSGRILILLRRDAEEAPGADCDEALALAASLRAEGFHIDIGSGFDVEQMPNVGIIHAIGLLDPAPIDEAIQAAKSRGIPVVISPLFEDAAMGGRWGMNASRSLLASLNDESELDRALEQLAHHRVEVDGVSAQVRWDDGLDGMRREVLRRADVVTVQSEEEREAVQRFSGRRRRTAAVTPLIYCSEAPDPIAHLVPDTPYVLVHACADARHNLGLLMRALRALELPTVMIAPHVDRRLVRLLQAQCGVGTAILPYTSVAQTEAIYARASVYVDAAWIGDGIARLMKAFAYGAEIVVSQARFLPEMLQQRVSRVDPASVRAIQAGIADAWQRALGDTHEQRHTIHLALEPTQALRTYVLAYAQAGEHLSRPPVYST